MDGEPDSNSINKIPERTGHQAAKKHEAGVSGFQKKINEESFLNYFGHAINIFKNDPRAQHDVVLNPYAREANIACNGLKLEFNTDTIRSAILAESSGQYDIDVSMLSNVEKRELFYKEIDISAEITIKLSKFIGDNSEFFWVLSEEKLYDALSRTAFGTEDALEINKNFSISQRRDFRLAIVNFIEDLHLLRTYNKKAYGKTPLGSKLIFEDIIRTELNDSVQIEVTPVGVVGFLSGSDYMRVTHDPSSMAELWFNPELDHGLLGKIAVVNRRGYNGDVFRISELVKSRSVTYAVCCFF